MKAVILAAGRGERLSPYTEKQPKPLIPILGKPLLECVIDAFRSVGVKDFVVVTGYMDRAIRSFFGDGRRLGVRIRYAYNPAYAGGNALSLKAAEEHLEKQELFILSMADHLFDPSNVEKVLQEVERGPLLCVDRSPRYLLHLGEATKVLVDKGNYVRRIGKELTSWNGLDTGLFLLDPTVFEVVTKTAEEVTPLTLSHCIRHLIRENPLWACDVSESLWLDVDTWEDLEHARRLMES